jgi:hypothetical protein
VPASCWKHSQGIELTSAYDKEPEFEMEIQHIEPSVATAVEAGQALESSQVRQFR